MENEDIQFGKGGIREDIPDPRDYVWGRDVGMATVPFDWDKGYDVEQELSTFLGREFKITVKDQNGSSSCGGQAWSYYGQVLNAFHDKNTDERSAKFIYAQTFVGVGGSGGRENCDIAIKQGWGLEIETPSYDSGKAPSEAFMQRKTDITDTARLHAKLDKALSYANVLNREVEDIATAIRDNHGCIFGINGSQNGTWRSAFPLPPATFNNTWAHWVYVGKCKLINGKRYFGLINSWGISTGDKGWQWISEDYVKTFILGYPVVWSIWTMVEADDVVTPPPFKFTKTLKYGMRNGDVRMLQMKLGGLITDGYFGVKTLAAVKAFQTAHGLVADGIVGVKTIEKLNLT